MNDNEKFTNSGALFKNDRIISDRSPAYRGACDVRCPHCGEIGSFHVSAWVKTKLGLAEKFLALAFTKKENRAVAPEDDRPF